MPRLVAGGEMNTITDKEIKEYAPRLGYFLAQSGSFNRVHICREHNDKRVVGICGQTADPTAPVRKDGNLCGSCRKRVAKEVIAVKRDQDKLQKWSAS
jgi:bacterioferritin-associated ferredoxin